MKTVRWVMLSGALLAVAACGSHNHAPVVYGSDPARQTRVYSSPDEILREQENRRRQAQQTRTAEAPGYRQPVYQPRSAAAVEPAQLTPVSAVYLEEPPRRAAQPAQAHLHKAKGYIEVQRGDTVYAIARRFNVSPNAVIDENDLKAPYALDVGQVLKLPDGAKALAVDAPARAAPTRAAPAPTRQVVARDQLYEVRPGDTLYGVSRRTGVPVTQIAEANNLRAPYALAVGRQLLIPQAPTGATRPLLAQNAAPAPRASEPAPPENVAALAREVSYTPPPSSAPAFDWPVRGSVIAGFGAGDLGRRNDGVNIAAPVGAPVRAAADGQVVYRGSELEGYGNLLLVKHQDGYVTAYAHNDTMLVKKGQQVRKGEVIAKVGQSGAVTTPQLHFQIRQDTRAVDPVALLGKP